MTKDNSILDKAIRRVPDFPKPGILFYDITSIFTNPPAFQYCIEEFVKLYRPMAEKGEITAIAGAESRGFLFAAPLAEKLNLPLILVRKKGKLPGEVYRQSYDLEYGSAEIEIHKADVKVGEKVLLIDDLIATGGTLNASRKLFAMAGAEIVAIAGVIGLPELNFEKVLAPTPVTTLINFQGK
ncbi:MAG: adenine phosphoribosyltransferase [Treponema sp.]|nr:adenine phosphoribosyltransferase [Candidatus Treponema equifaecale]